MSEPDPNQIARDIMRVFAGPPRKRKPMKPNRCLGCGKVTALIFCRATYAECQAAYRERRNA